MTNHNKCTCKLLKRILYKIKDLPAPLYLTIAINLISTLARITMPIMRDTWLKRLTILGGRIMFRVIEEGGRMEMGIVVLEWIYRVVFDYLMDEVNHTFLMNMINVDKKKYLRWSNLKELDPRYHIATKIYQDWFFYFAMKFFDNVFHGNMIVSTASSILHTLD